MLALANNPENTIDLNYDPFTNEVVARIPGSTQKRARARRLQDESRRNTLLSLLQNRSGQVIQGNKYVSPGDSMTLYWNGDNLDLDPRAIQRMDAIFNGDTYSGANGVTGFKTMKTIEGVRDLYDDAAKQLYDAFKSNPTKDNWEKVKYFFDEANISAAEKDKTEKEILAEKVANDAKALVEKG